jgi:hypothetical protein
MHYSTPSIFTNQEPFPKGPKQMEALNSLHSVVPPTWEKDSSVIESQPMHCHPSCLPPLVLQQIKRSPRLSLPSSCQPLVDMREPERTRWSSVELH